MHIPKHRQTIANSDWAERLDEPPVRSRLQKQTRVVLLEDSRLAEVQTGVVRLG